MIYDWAASPSSSLPAVFGIVGKLETSGVVMITNMRRGTWDDGEQICVTLLHTTSRRTSFEIAELKFFEHVGTARACSALGTVVSGEAVSCKGLEVNVSPHFEASLII